MLTDSQRLSRQRQLIHPKAAEYSVLIYGAGMLGSWTTHALARMVDTVTIWDGEDVVEVENIGSQAYCEVDIGEPKGEALMLALNGMRVWHRAERFPLADIAIPPDIIIACADSMQARRDGAEWSGSNGTPLFIDTRAQGLEATIITVGPKEYGDYLGDLPSDDDMPAIPCGERGTAFVGMFVASRVASIVNIYAAHGLNAIPKRETWNVQQAVPFGIERR